MDKMYYMKTTFADALMIVLGDKAVSLKAVAEGSGVSYEQLKKIKQGKSKSTNVEDAMRVASYFGTTVEEFTNDPITAIKDELARLVAGLKPEEREIVLSAATGVSSRLRKSED